MAYVYLFPWITVDKICDIGDYTIAPFSPHTTQLSFFLKEEKNILKSIQKSFFERFSNPHFIDERERSSENVRSFSVCKKKGKSVINKEKPPLVDEEFVMLQDVLAFDYFLNKRELFKYPYLNTDCFHSIIQPIQEDKLNALFIRTKKYYSECYSLAGNVRYIVQVKPHHIPSENRRPKVNVGFCNEIFDIMKNDPLVRSFIGNFNQVFTDNPAVSTGKDVNFAVSAMEKIALNVNGVKYSHELKEEKFVQNILYIINQYKIIDQSWIIPNEDIRKSSFRKKVRDELNDKNSKLKTWYPDDILKCWIMDVYRVRNHYAHGNYSKREFIWTELEHKVIFSLIGPILFKLKRHYVTGKEEFLLNKSEINILNNLGKILSLKHVLAKLSNPSICGYQISKYI